ncbi:MAG: CDP-diacylglycerol--serine O-phosphatidyltransferase, partial [Candidatus Zixiibacteriota bacterium]
KMISLKLSSYSISAAFFQYLLLFFSLIFLVTVGWIAIPLIIYFYIVLSIAKNLFFVKE